MEPPPLTVSKRRDPLRDGVVFPAVAQDSPGPLQLVRPSPLPQAGPASGGLPSSSLLRTAAEAAAINRSMEAQQIRRQWDALVGASPLPQAFRHGLSPASVGRPALGGYPSPAVRAPPLYHTSMPSAHGPGLAAGYGSVAPSAIYRSTVQQRQQEQRQQQQQVAGLEVEASKYTHILHSHSPGYQAVVSSTVQVVRQSGPAQPLPPAPRHPLGSGSGSGGISIEELPVGGSQQQEQRPYGAHPQPVMVLNVPLLPSPAAAPQQQQQQQQQQPCLSPQQVAAALAAVPLARGALPSAAGAQQLGAAPTMPEQGPGAESGQSGLPGGMPASKSPCQPSQQAGRGGRQVQQTAEADLAYAGSLVHQHGDAGRLAGQAGELDGPPHSPAALEDEAHSMEAALAQVGALVRDLQTPVPDDEAEAEADEAQHSQQRQQVGPASSAAAVPGSNHAGEAGQPLGAEQGDREQQMPLEEPPQQQQQQQQNGAPLDGPAEQPVLAAQAQPAPAHKEQWRESKGERRPRRTTAVRGTALPVAAAGVGGDDMGAAAAGAAGPAAQQEQEMEQAPSAPPAAADLGAADLASQQQASSSRAKEQQPGGKGVKKRVKAEAASGKRRTMLLRADAAKVEPLHRALGGDAAPGGNGIETTRSGRHRIKPLPFWASSRLVLNSNKDVVGIEQREDLLGISHQPGQQPKRGPAVKSEPSKPAGGGAAAKPPRPAGKGTAQGKGAGTGKHHPGKVSAPQQQQQQQQAEQSRRGRQREAKAKPQAQHEQEGPAEVEAALQLQQLGRGEGEDAAVPPAMPTVQQPRTAAASPPRTQVGALGLAALAASAGAQAAAAVAPRRAAGTGAGAAAAAKRAPRSSAAAAAAVQEGSGKGGDRPAAEALPVVPGVPQQVMRDLAQLPDAQRRKKCGHCKHCLQPSMKQACLALRALRNWESEQQQEGAAPAAAATAALPAGAQQAGGSKQPDLQQAKGGKHMQQQESQPLAAAAAAGKAKGKKRAAAAEQQAPSPKKARGRPRQQRDLEQAEESPPPGPGPEAAGGEQQEQEEADEQGWTASQVVALQRAWLQIDPTASNFWQLVAKQVPGKTATDCYNRHMARHPTPPHPTRKAAPRKYLAAAQEGARLPEIKPGASKQVMQNAARKYTRQLQWQQKASKAQEAADGGRLSSELVEEMEAAERKDRYIDQILRKRQGRPLGMAARGRKPAGVVWPPAAASQHPVQPGVQAGGLRTGQAVGCEQEVRAALAGLQAHESEEDRDSQEDSDYYWSDA